MCISFVKGWRKGQNQEVKKPSLTGRSCWEKKKLEENIGSEITIRQENKIFLHKKKNSSYIIIACLLCCELKLTSSADEPPKEN